MELRLVSIIFGACFVVVFIPVALSYNDEKTAFKWGPPRYFAYPSYSYRSTLGYPFHYSLTEVNNQDNPVLRRFPTYMSYGKRYFVNNRFPFYLPRISTYDNAHDEDDEDDGLKDENEKK